MDPKNYVTNVAFLSVSAAAGKDNFDYNNWHTTLCSPLRTTSPPPPTAWKTRGLNSVCSNRSLFLLTSYNSKMGNPAPECAVCLSEFEDDERGRLLPKCGHVFHNDCIEMWVQSHSNCPLCRSPVQLQQTIICLEHLQ